MEYSSSVKIVNSQDIELRFDLEPWGEQYTMPPRTKFTVVVSAPSRGELEVQIQENIITVFGWSGSTIRLFRDGIEVNGTE